MAFSGAFVKPFRPAFDAGLAVAAVAGNGLLNNLVAYWALDEAAGANNALDAHTNALTLTQVGLPGSGAGKIGTARTFSGTGQYFKRTSETLLQTGTAGHTFAFWVQLSAASGFMHIAVKDYGPGREYDIVYFGGSGVDKFAYYQFMSDSSYKVVNATLPSPAIVGTWYFVVARYDPAANIISLSVNNGTVYSVDTTGKAPATSTCVLNIGNRDNGAAGDLLQGSIDELGFWKGRVLSAADIALLYNGGVGLAYAAFTT